MHSSDSVNKLKQELYIFWATEFEVWFLKELIRRFPGEGLGTIIKKVEVQKWPDQTVLVTEGVPFAVWINPEFKVEVEWK